MIGPAQRAANQRALAHGDVPADFTGNVPLTAQQQLDDLQWQVDQMRDRGYTDSEIATVLSKGSTALGGPASGLQSAGALANTGVHHAGSLPSAAQAARSAAVGTVLSRLSVAVEVASGVIKWREGAPRGETVGNSGGAIALGWAGGKGGAALGGFLGGPIGAAVGAESVQSEDRYSGHTWVPGQADHLIEALDNDRSLQEKGLRPCITC
ncbi:hypothetical protein ACETU7_24685 [Rhodococcus sp. 3Y1]